MISKEDAIVQVRQRHALSKMPEEIRNDFDVVLEAIRSSPDQIRWCSPSLKNNPDIVIESVERDGNMMQFASDELKNNRDFAMLIVTLNASAYYHLSEALQNDREIVMLTVRQNGLLLERVPKNLRLTDREVVLTAVKQNWHALEFTSLALLDDPEIIIEALRQDVNAINEIGVQLAGDKHFLYEISTLFPGIPFNAHQRKLIQQMESERIKYTLSVAQEATKRQELTHRETGYAPRPLNNLLKLTTQGQGSNKKILTKIADFATSGGKKRKTKRKRKK